MASMSVITSPQWFTAKSIRTQMPAASLTLLTGSRRRIAISPNTASNTKACSSLLHCSFLPSSSSSLSLPSSFSGLSLRMDFSSNNGPRSEKRRGLVVRAGKAALCQTKRNRSRKSLARTHGFRKRTSTTSGRVVLKRRRAKVGRSSAPNSTQTNCQQLVKMGDAKYFNEHGRSVGMRF